MSFLTNPNKVTYRKVVISKMSRLVVHVGIYRLLMKGIFDAYVVWPFYKKFIFELVTRVNTCDYTVDLVTNASYFSRRQFF